MVLPSGPISNIVVLVKATGLLTLFACGLFGQEGPEVIWEHDEVRYSLLDWEVLLGAMFVALAFCGVWRLLVSFLESKRSTINWKKARVWWPTSMLVWGGVVLVFGTMMPTGGPVLDVLAWSFIAINIPAIILAAAVAGILEEILSPAEWVHILAGALTFWMSAYLMVRFAEYRAWVNVHTSLHLTDRSVVVPKDSVS